MHITHTKVLEMCKSFLAKSLFCQVHLLLKSIEFKVPGWLETSMPSTRVVDGSLTCPVVCEILCNLFHSTSEYEKCFPSKNVSLMLTLQWNFILTHILWLPLQEGCIGCAQLSKPVHGSSRALERGVMGCLWTQRWPECKRGLSTRSRTIPEWWDSLPTEGHFISHR